MVKSGTGKKIWNVHDATVNGDARTNNMCEGWNDNFFNLVGHAHPSIWRVIESLILVIESDVPPNSTQVLGNGLLASSEVSA
jgi:hypothetical protein